MNKEIAEKFFDFIAKVGTPDEYGNIKPDPAKVAKYKVERVSDSKENKA